MKEKYKNLNGLRVYAAIALVFFHVNENWKYRLSGFVFDRLMASIFQLTFLFMVLSAFSMCCGYYDRFKDGTIDLNSFYKRRYQKIWPFFALFCTLEVIIDHSLHSLYEWFADITLAFGLLPNQRINVVGVGWFIGTVFVFYMIFPFFTFLMDNKPRAWVVMGTSVVLNILCQQYFFDSHHMLSGFFQRSNFLYSFVFFVTGGLIYLYRNEVTSIANNKLAIILMTLIALSLYFAFGSIDLVCVIVFGLFTILGISVEGDISRRLLQNKLVQLISPVTMEIYLCHMFVFRVLEKLGIVHIAKNDIVSFIIIGAATTIGSVITAVVLKKMIENIATKRIRWA